MNLRKIILVVGAGITLLLCLAGFVSAYRAFAQANAVKGTLDRTYKQLQAIYAENPFPCATNMAVVRGDTAWLTNWHGVLVKDLFAAAVPASVPSASGFIEKLQNTSAALQRRATAGGGRMLPDGFAFGFERYLGSRIMPKPENVKRLDLQFSLVEALTREILDCQVVELSQFERERFDGDGAEGGPVPAGRRRGVPAVQNEVAVATASGGFPREHFSLTFTSSEKALTEVLNRLARMPVFVVVTEVRVERVDRGLRARPDRAGLDAAKEKGGMTVLRAPQRVVSGPDVAPLLKTQMQLDVYTFEGV
jgi:hypothetical protein